MRNASLSAALLIACTAATFAQPRVEGVVLNAVTGEGVLRARVTLRAAKAQYVTSTDEQGHFTMRGIPAGSYAAAASRPGFTPEVVKATGEPSVAVEVAPGETVTQVRLRLLPTGAVAGRVLDSDGEPVQSEEVAAISTTGTTHSAATDEQGRFRFGSLSPGRYRVRAAPAGIFANEVRTDGSKRVYYATTWYPAALEPKEASRILVGPGTEIAIEIRLIPRPVLRVAGRVTPVVRQTSVVLTKQRSQSFVVRPDGTFEALVVDPGKYTLSASGNGMTSAAVEVEIGAGDVEGIELAMTRPLPVTGRVRYAEEGARPIENATPALLPIGRGGRQVLSAATIQEDGAFRFENAPPGVFRLQVNWPDTYVKEILIGSDAREGAMLDLRAAPGAPLTVVLSSEMGEISGSVVASQTLEGKAVMLWDVSGSALPRQAPLTAGRFSLRAPPGKYQLGLVDLDAIPSSPEDSEYATEPVELRARETATIELRVSRPL